MTGRYAAMRGIAREAGRIAGRGPCRREGCGHPERSHRHYRPGTHCGDCPCRAYRKPLPGWAEAVIGAFGHRAARRARKSSCPSHVIKIK